MFLKFDCDCIGFYSSEMEAPWVFKPCDNDSHWVYGIFPRPELATKSREKMTATEVASLFSDLGHLVNDGYKYRDIRALLI